MGIALDPMCCSLPVSCWIRANPDTEPGLALSCDSDVKHRLRSPQAFALALQIRQGEGLQNAYAGLVDAIAERLEHQKFGGFSLAFALKPAVALEAGLHGCHSDGGGVLGELKAPPRAANAVQKAAFTQGGEHLLEVPLGDAMTAADFAGLQQSAGTVGRSQLDQSH